jgi:hypothetical protein
MMRVAAKVIDLATAAPHDECVSTAAADLGTLEAARLEVWCRVHHIPPSTLRAVIAQGAGPATITIGRLIFITRRAWSAWIAELETNRGTGPLSPPAGRRHVSARSPRNPSMSYTKGLDPQQQTPPRME